MSIRRSLTILPTAVFLITACSTTHVHWDAVKMREHVIDYYTDEIMDNLIRGSQGLPFVHVDISSLNAAVTSKFPVTVAGGQTINNTSSRQSAVAGITTTLTRLAVRPFTFGATPERDDLVTVNSAPVLDKPQGLPTLHSIS